MNIDFETWINRVQRIAFSQGLNHEDVESFKNQDCWKGYWENNYNPKKAVETEFSYA